jgi:hypothetical protein
MRHAPIKRLLALSASGLLSVGVCACGSTSTNTTSTHADTVAQTATKTATAPESPYNPYEANVGQPKPKDRDLDGDSNSDGRYDSDDKSVLDYGHPANAQDTRAITALVQRYYAAAAAENGAKACSMIYSTFAEAISEDYGTSPPGPKWAQGTSCPAVMTLIFKHFHSQIAARLPKLKVSRVRLREHQGLVFLSFGKLPEREIRVDRESHTWRILALIDNDLP